MEHILGDASFQYDDADGKTQTVKGHLFVNAPNDGDYSASRTIGQVQFRTADLTDTQAQKQADSGGGTQSPPPPAQ